MKILPGLLRRSSFEDSLSSMLIILIVDTDDDDIGNIQLVSPHADDIVLGKPVSSDWRPVPPLGNFILIEN